MVEEIELDVVPSEKNAESDDAAVGFVGGWVRGTVTGDFDWDECELLGRRRSIILLGVVRRGETADETLLL